MVRPMVRLILMRHGTTDYHAARRYCGFSNPPLNHEGTWQSRQLAARLKDLRIDKIYASDLMRARQTAKIVFENESIEQATDLREMNFGVFEGLRHEKIMERYPVLYRDWVDNPAKVKPPNGEGLRDLSTRVKERIAAILSQHEGKTVAVVTHGGPIRIVLCDALQFDLTMFWQIRQECGALNVIDYADGAPPAAVAVNDVSHLSAPETVRL